MGRCFKMMDTYAEYEEVQNAITSETNLNDIVKDGEELYEDPEDCDNCPEIVSTVSFDLQKWHELQYIKDLQKGKEFAVYLLGNFDEKGVPEIQDYYIPEQEVSATEATITEDELPPEVSNKIIGHLHSHHGMGHTPSGTDIHHLNYPVHIIISNNGESCTVRKKAECGRIMKRQAEIQLTYNVSGIQGLDKIRPITYVNQYYGVRQSWNNQPRRIWRNGKWEYIETPVKSYQEYDEDTWNNSVKGSPTDVLNNSYYSKKELKPGQKLSVGME